MSVYIYTNKYENDFVIKGFGELMAIRSSE